MKVADSYGAQRRRREDVSYAQIEEAAQAILLTGVRPTVDGIRKAINAGSQRTLLVGLQRFWKDLGARLSGFPDSRRRLPPTVADLADRLWLNALTLATEAAAGADTALKAELTALRIDVEVRGHALTQREIEIESLVRSREQAIKELEEHLRATTVDLGMRDATIQSLESRLATALAETEGYRRRLATVVGRAVMKHRTEPSRQKPAIRGKLGTRLKRASARKKSGSSKGARKPRD